MQNHRDPLKVVASLVSLVCTLRSLASDEIDPHEIGRDWTQRLAAGLDHATRVRDAAKLPASQVFDVPFREFMADEIAMVRKIYEHFGMEYTAEAERRMRELPRRERGRQARPAQLRPGARRPRRADGAQALRGVSGALRDPVGENGVGVIDRPSWRSNPHSNAAIDRASTACRSAGFSRTIDGN